MVGHPWICLGCGELYPNRLLAKPVRPDDDASILVCPNCLPRWQAYEDIIPDGSVCSRELDRLLSDCCPFHGVIGEGELWGEWETNQ